jgi:hypothetical protein
MSMFDQSRDFRMASQVIHSIFLYAACTAEGFVKVGISRAPFERIYTVHVGSPSPVRAAQWVWIGSLSMGHEIERAIRKEWASRNTRGEWYRFDYSKPADKADFHDTLSAVVEVVTGKAPNWERLRPERVDQLLKEEDRRRRPQKAR